ncbi:MAG: hypothetical protein O7C72_07970 [Deltaproteobacteria bacterium]|nr:hypothetical protein [Deltaproteobacteria bacterium]
MMTRATVDAILRFIQKSEIPTVDITGGAPELKSTFDYPPERSKPERASGSGGLSANPVQCQLIHLGNRYWPLEVGSSSGETFTS